MSVVRAFLFLALAACSPKEPEAATPPVTLTLGAYAVARESYSLGILPAFQAHWKEVRNQDVSFEESYQASGAQARAIRDGFEADVAALSIATDVHALEKAGLVTSDWSAGPWGGIASRSIVVLAVRPGNPKGITGWADLARPGVEVITPNVRTSGGAMWNVLALYGAAIRGQVEGVPAGDPAAAERLLAAVLANVEVMDKAGRESMVTFEGGVGDVAITYENEVFTSKQAGNAMDYVVPTSTIAIENPVVVVDEYARKHGTEEIAQAFVAFLATPEAQAIFAAHGMRPAEPSATIAGLPPVADLFTVADLGGWAAVDTAIFAKDAAYDRAIATTAP